MLIQHRNHVLDTITLLINSCPPASLTDELSDVKAIQEFIEARTITEVAGLTQFDVAQLNLVRSQLRAIFVAPDEATRIRLVNDALTTARITPRLVEHDHLGIHFHYFSPYASLSEHLIADCAMAIASLIDAGEVTRLKFCSAPNCSRVFVDSSRNRSRAYCDGKTCGARVHAASYRQRQRK